MADSVAQHLGQGYVFFAPWWEHYLAGTDADLKLQQIYTTAVLTVVCVSGPTARRWTLAEWQAINARVMQAMSLHRRIGEARRPAGTRGDGDPPGLFANTIAPDVRGRTGPIGGTRARPVPAGRRRGGRAPPRRRLEDTGSEDGDTLDRLSGRYLGSSADWRQIAFANGILDPLAIMPGDILIIPERETEDA